MGGGAELTVGEQGAAGGEVVTAQGDGVAEPADLCVAVAEVVDEGGVNDVEVLGVPDATLGPFQGLAGAASGVKFAGDHCTLPLRFT
ncbi:hypothetical protein GCM10022233_55480 [Streptomyces shaanxiensis]|uniref:Uncharacterized protein n=1 Tax=Streptomyces shaanxiensis TaxID=653357 RepID=A0ABP7VQ40_9ACTN